MMRLPAMSVAVAVALFVPALGVSATPMVLSPSLVA
jgi:hypothetical protein